MYEKKIKVLVVEDQIVNRKMLCGILEKEYIPIEASNGKEALRLLAEDKEIAAVLLDLVMPIMDGYEFLEQIKEKQISNLPIIAMTSSNNNETELHTLDNGAWDFVTKPYRPLVLLRRLRNAIARSRMYLLEQMEYMAEHDMLTGVYNRQKMFAEVKEIRNKYPEKEFAFIKTDIDKFRLINSFWGEKEGDKYLSYMASILREEFENDYSTIGRMTSDVFCIFAEYNKDEIENKIKRITNKLKDYDKNFTIESFYGIYIVNNKKLTPDQMFARAQIASREGKDKHINYITYFEEAMEKHLLEEQEVINNISKALENNEFLVYLQPKTSLFDEKAKGAEALVRWKHPKDGIKSPGTFISVLEKNGYIGQLDFYMWEKVCSLLAKWNKEGRELFPISVNVSRMNLYNPNLTEILLELVKKYNISQEYFQLELTEGDCVDNNGIINEAIDKLKEAGFTILMDDFGSGYSSLNALKDMNIDILKVDMAFLSETKNQAKSDIILSSIIKLAKELKIPVVAEGAENKKQIELLKNNRCDYVQGYYYAKPMPVDEYLEYIDKQ